MSEGPSFSILGLEAAMTGAVSFYVRRTEVLRGQNPSGGPLGDLER